MAIDMYLYQIQYFKITYYNLIGYCDFFAPENAKKDAFIITILSSFFALFL